MDKLGSITRSEVKAHPPGIGSGEKWRKGYFLAQLRKNILDVTILMLEIEVP